MCGVQSSTQTGRCPAGLDGILRLELSLSLNQQEGAWIPEYARAAVRDSALPHEYRYSTRLGLCLFGGVAVMVALAAWGSGGLALSWALLALLSTALGAMGLLADPAGFLHALGKRLVVTGASVQEIDEKAQVRWFIQPYEVVRVELVRGRPVFPWSGPRGWHVEHLLLHVRGGQHVRIPLWLLPERGAPFRKRLAELLQSDPGCAVLAPRP